MRFSISISLERFDPNSDMRTVAAQALELVQIAEQGGFEIAWTPEHHTIEFTIAPNPFTILTHWAAHTRTIRLGTAVVVAPYWHPIRVAGEAAGFADAEAPSESARGAAARLRQIGAGVLSEAESAEILRLVGVPLVASHYATTLPQARAAAESVGYPVRALRFVDNVYDYMHAADVLVTKPGGLTAAEALVAGLPMVLCKPLPGQEERNARILCEAGAAVRSRAVADLAASVDAVLAPGGRRARMLVSARRIARPNAAAEAASLIARLVRMRKEVVA